MVLVVLARSMTALSSACLSREWRLSIDWQAACPICEMHDQAMVSRNGADGMPCGGLEVCAVKRSGSREKRSGLEDCRFHHVFLRGAPGQTGIGEMPRLERHRGAQGVEGAAFARWEGGDQSELKALENRRPRRGEDACAYRNAGLKSNVAM